MQTIPESETALLLRTGEEPTPDALSGHEKAVVALVIEGTCPDRTPGSGCCEAHWGGRTVLSAALSHWWCQSTMFSFRDCLIFGSSELLLSLSG